MAEDWRDVILHDFTPEQRARVEQEGRELAAVHRALAELRKAHGKTQDDVADAMGINQAAVSKMESRGPDILLSSLQRYVAGVGGTVRIMIEHEGQVEEIAL